MLQLGHPLTIRVYRSLLAPGSVQSLSSALTPQCAESAQSRMTPAITSWIWEYSRLKCFNLNICMNDLSLKQNRR